MKVRKNAKKLLILVGFLHLLIIVNTGDLQSETREAYRAMRGLTLNGVKCSSRSTIDENKLGYVLGDKMCSLARRYYDVRHSSLTQTGFYVNVRPPFTRYYRRYLVSCHKALRAGIRGRAYLGGRPGSQIRSPRITKRQIELCHRALANAVVQHADTFMAQARAEIAKRKAKREAEEFEERLILWALFCVLIIVIAVWQRKLLYKIIEKVLVAIVHHPVEREVKSALMAGRKIDTASVAKSLDETATKPVNRVSKWKEKIKAEKAKALSDLLKAEGDLAEDIVEREERREEREWKQKNE